MRIRLILATCFTFLLTLAGCERHGESKSTLGTHTLTIVDTSGKKPLGGSGGTRQDDVAGTTTHFFDSANGRYKIKLVDDILTINGENTRSTSREAKSASWTTESRSTAWRQLRTRNSRWPRSSRNREQKNARGTGPHAFGTPGNQMENVATILICGLFAESTPSHHKIKDLTERIKDLERAMRNT